MAIATHAETVLPWRLILGTGFGKGEEHGPDVVAEVAALEAGAVAKRVQPALADARPVDSDAMRSLIGVLDQGSGAATVELQPNLADLQAVCAEVALGGIEVRTASLVEWYRPGAGATSG